MAFSERVHRSPSFEEVTEQLSEPLQRYLGRFAGDLQSAEDLLQETLIRISRGLPGFEGRSSLKTWAFSVATRTAIDHLRKSKAGSRIVEIEDTEDLSDPIELIEERLIVEEMNSCIRQEIDSLP